MSAHAKRHAREIPVGDVDRLAEREEPDNPVPSPEDYALLRPGQEPPHSPSLTAVAAEALRTGLYPEHGAQEVPGQDGLLRAGDPDVDPLENEYSGEEIPGASTPTPDQAAVDDLGRAYGLAEEDSGGIVGAEELLSRRDARRWDQEPLPPKDHKI